VRLQQCRKEQHEEQQRKLSIKIHIWGRTKSFPA
jgi:hypothetical protein